MTYEYDFYYDMNNTKIRVYFDRLCLVGFFLPCLILFIAGLIEHYSNIKLFSLNPTTFWLLFIIGNAIGIYGVFTLEEPFLVKIVSCILFSILGFFCIGILGFIIALIWGVGGAQ